jgi:fumarylacetoacetase
MSQLNHTHDPAARSWVLSANLPAADFPIQNLPLGVFSTAGSLARVGLAIGDQVLDIQALSAIDLVASTSVADKSAALQAVQACRGNSLNALMALGPHSWQALRHALFELLSDQATETTQSALRACLVPQSQVQMHLPAQVGDYTDFYTSIYHATNVGKLFRPDNPLLPNYRWVPIGYHGRASSLQVSGSNFHRPHGQVMAPGADRPELKPTARLDWELELGVYMGQGNALGQPIALDDALDHVFGVCLLNDWSARDVQAWEYQPLGPFLAKNFATTLSPWVVTLEALAPYRAAMQRPLEDMNRQDLPYLHSTANREHGAYDIRLQVGLRSAAMRETGQDVHWVCHTSYRHAYWTIAQLVAHHTVNGCNLKAGDVLGTGTLSGPTLEEAGALLELTQGGKHALTLPSGETRTFVQDGDEVIMRAWCEAPGRARLGLGECVARVLPAVSPAV